MRVAVYQRWLATLGGGERYTLELALALRDLGHAVTILTHQPVESGAILQRLGLDIDSIAIETLPFDPLGQHIGMASQHYDWFINATHGMLIDGQAAHNTLLVWFPLPLDQYDRGGAIGPSRLDSTHIEYLGGVYETESHAQWLWRWTGPHVEAALRWRWPGTPAALRLECAPVWSPAIPAPQIRVFADEMPIATRSDWWKTWVVLLPERRRGAWNIRLEITGTQPTPAEGNDPRHLGMPLANLTLQGSLGCLWHGGAIGRPLHPSDIGEAVTTASLDRYQSIWTISEFSADWLKRRWERQSSILYPAVAPVEPRQKLRQIVSVGRFFTGAHNKKHGPLIEAFQALCDQGLRDWEYHLVGGCDDEQPEQRAYVEALQEQARGYPIAFHINASLETLHERYGQAMIFWHAAGFEEDIDTTPERMEHFGIATVEAMSAGCIPIVVDLAGQAEIVQHNLSGFRWKTLSALQQQTRSVIEQPELSRRVANAAQRRAEHFNAVRFRERLAVLIPSNDETV